MEKQISAGEFETNCLKFMNQVRTTGEEIVITKCNIAIARLAPIRESKPPTLFGYLKGSVHIKEDIINPIEEEWDVCR